jgi:hypothetical protein
MFCTILSYWPLFTYGSISLLYTIACHLAVPKCHFFWSCTLSGPIPLLILACRMISTASFVIIFSDYLVESIYHLSFALHVCKVSILFFPLPTLLFLHYPLFLFRHFLFCPFSTKFCRSNEITHFKNLFCLYPFIVHTSHA